MPAGDTARLDAELLLTFALGAPRSLVLARLDEAVGAATAAHYRELVARRARGEPLAYITGTKEFYSLLLEVTPAVLVPRPETELLVDAVLERFEDGARFKLLDLGTGSGALAIAIRHARPNAEVWAADASEDALALARRNAELLGVNGVRWVHTDWFASLAGERFDVDRLQSAVRAQRGVGARCARVRAAARARRRSGRARCDPRVAARGARASSRRRLRCCSSTATISVRRLSRSRAAAGLALVDARARPGRSRRVLVILSSPS